jgi:integrase
VAVVKFYLEKRKDKSGEVITSNVPIRLVYSFNGNRLEYFTGERVDSKFYQEEYWKDIKKSPIKKTAPGAEKINRNLNSLRLQVEKLHSDAKALGIIPTVNYFKTKLKELNKGSVSEKEMLVINALQEFLEDCKAKKAPNTVKNSNTFINHFKSFIGVKKCLSLYFSEIDSSFIERFNSYLTNELNQLNNTVAKNIRVLRTFLNFSKERGYFDGANQLNIKVKENETEVIFLSYEEVLHLYNFDLQNQSLSQVRDVFVFGCFSGMRYSDIAKLKKSDVSKDFIKFYITKGGRTTTQTVPLISQSKAILSKYSDIPGELALPVISNQKMNDYLKEVAELVGMDEVITIAEKRGNRIVEKEYKKHELITCHVSRKTFITVAMTLGMSESVIKSITGHSKNSKAFSRYYSIVDNVKQSEMNRIFNAIEA